MYLRIIKLLLAFALAGTLTLQAEEAYEMNWVKQFGTAGYEITFGSSTIDGNDNVFVTGSTPGVLDGESSHGDVDAYIRKHSSNGELIWTRQFGTSGYDIARSITTDNSGNVFVTGYSNAAPSSGIYGNHDVFITKYSNDGIFQWTKYHGMRGYYDHGNDIVVDNSGNIYVTGSTRNYPNNLGYDAMFVSKSSSDGTLQWIKYLDHNSSREGVKPISIGEGIITDSIGNIYITGHTSGELPGETDVTTNRDTMIIKYNSDGTLLWNRQLASRGGSEGMDITIDKSGYFFVTGSTFYPSYEGSSGVFITKYDSNGTHFWTKEVSNYSAQYGQSITSDNDDNILISGFTTGAFDGEVSSGGKDAFIIKYSNSGTLLWLKQFGTSGNDNGYSVVSNSKNDIFVAGFTYGAFDGEINRGGVDSFLAKFSSPNTAPVAVAAATPQAVVLNGTTVALDASQSYDPDADNITYAWTLVQTPLNSMASLSDASSINPTFMPDLKGDYILSLDVTDAFGASAHTEITVSFDNIKPVADADVNQSVVSGYPIYLNGSASSDANGDTLTYSWEILSQPAESSAAILDPTAAKTSLSADEEGLYTLSLIVNDGTIDSDPANLSIELITPQTAAKRLIQQAIAEVKALPDSSFKNAKRRKALLKKLMVITKMLDSSKYKKAVHKLSHDILPKVEDSKKKGWIITPELSSVYALISQAIIYLQGDDENHHKGKKYEDNDDENHHKYSKSYDDEDEHDKDKKCDDEHDKD